MTQREPSSFVTRRVDAGVDLVVTGDWSKEAATAISAGSADGLVLNYALGFRERSLGFIAGLPIRRLDILARTIKDLTPVYSLASTLDELSVQVAPTAVIDLPKLPRLRKLGASWSQIANSISHAPDLEDLFVLSYAPTDLTPLGGNQSLRRIVMKDRPRLESFSGIAELSRLRVFAVPGAKSLTDISEIEHLRSPLRELDLEGCRSVDDLVPVSACTDVQVLNFGDCGPVSSLQPLSKLQELERIFLYSTRVLDSDLSVLSRLPKLRDLRMQNRKGYRPTVPEIEEMLSGRPG